MKSLSIIFICLFFTCFSQAEERYQDLNLEKLQSLAQSDDTVAMAFLGELYEYGRGVEQDSQSAFKWYKKAAELNYAPAQYNLAVLLSNENKGMLDLPQAYFWAEKAAEQNNVNAQFLVGAFHDQGKGTFPSKQQAYKWYKRAADQDHSNAQYNLALLLLRGDGIEKNYTMGMKYLNNAAAQNHTQAKSVLNLIKNQQKK